MPFFRPVALCAVSLVWLLGCSGNDDKMETAPVTGVVKVHGEAIEGATVTFYPDKGKYATGMTDAEGKFTLTTYETGDGAVVGTHKVTISHAGEVLESNDEEALKQAAEATSLVPEKYGNMETSELSKTVEAGKNNEFEFDLK